MPKQLQFGDDARAAMKRGIDTMADTVGVTLGPLGRNVVLDKKFGPPQVCSDGVTIAKEIELEDPYENMGVQLLKEAANKTNEMAGDGTTTATILAHMAGMVALVNVEAGQAVNANMPVVEIVDPTVVEVDGIVDEIDVLFIQKGPGQR